MKKVTATWSKWKGSCKQVRLSSSTPQSGSMTIQVQLVKWTTITVLKSQLCLTLDVYKAAGVIAGKRKQLEASEEGGKYSNATW